MNSPAVFLDRDGTVMVEAEYLSDPAGVKLLPGAAAGIRSLRTAGFKIVITSNQSGVARGFFTEDSLKAVNARLQALLAAESAQADGLYYCPHLPDGNVPAYARVCDCRKPGPGMLIAASRDLGLDLARSWVVGDKKSDIEFGKFNGLRAVLVLTGYGEETRAAGFDPNAQPDRIAADLAGAAQAIAGFAPSARP